MTTVGLIVRLHAKPGKEAEVAESQIDGSTFAIVDAFPDQAGRQAHLEGAVAAALFGKAAELLAEPPTVEQVNVLADVLPG